MNGMNLGHYCGKKPVGGIPSVLGVATAYEKTMCYANADRLTLNKYLYV
jgi:hypothetical protein